MKKRLIKTVVWSVFCTLQKKMTVIKANIQSGSYGNVLMETDTWNKME